MDFFRAQWFRQQFPSYLVLFAAILRPKIFTPKLLELLFRGGAKLSSHLVQLLHHLRTRGTQAGQREERWGRAITDELYSAIVQAAQELYKSKVSLEDDVDERALSNSLREMPREGAVPPTALKIFEESAFMPLPLSFGFVDAFVDGSDSSSASLAVRSSPYDNAERLLLKEPRLASLLVANGKTHAQTFALLLAHFTCVYLLHLQATKRRTMHRCGCRAKL